MKNRSLNKKIVWFSSIFFLLVFLVISLLLNVNRGVAEKGIAFIEDSMVQITEGNYEERVFQDKSISYYFMNKEDREKIIKTTKSLVDNKFYELGNTLYKLEVTLAKSNIKIKAVPVYNEEEIIEAAAITDFDAIPAEKFIEVITQQIEKEYKYLNIGYDYKPLTEFIPEKRGQCYNFVELFYILANEKGLKVRVEVNSYHAWNLVEINGEWIKVDLTLNLEEGDGNYEIQKN